MEADRQIIRKFGEVVEGCTMDVMKYSMKTMAITGIAGYVSFKILKKIYVKYKVAKASSQLQAELREDQRIIEESILKWKNSEEYAEILSIAEGDSVEEYIASLKFEELVSALKEGKLSAFSVLKSYQIKALQSTEMCNNVVGWIKEADEMARKLDKLPKERRKAFHGVPISVKECFATRNTHMNAGMIYFYGEKSKENSPAVQTCINLGAVPFCKTNIPQAMYSMECTNPLYGTTGNPHNPLREPGGSSGGEGSLIGGKGSILGLGSDIGGSLRSPAACCGIYSMKPTIGRHLCNLDATATAGPDPARMEAIAGFMASSPKTLEYTWRTTYNLEGKDNAGRFDGLIAPVRFCEERFTKKVRIGYFFSEGLFEPVPGVKRSIEEAVKILSDHGYQTVQFQPPDIEEVLRLFNGIICADMSYLENFMSWDVYSSAMSGITVTSTLMSLPSIIRKLIINPLLKWLTNIPPLVKYYSKTSDMYKALVEKDMLAQQYFQLMEKTGVDVILCPGQIVPALPAGVAGTFIPILLPYLFWNVLNMPAGIAPVTRYNATDDGLMESYPRNNLTYKLIHRYTKGAEGLPLTVQVVARPYHEEQILQVMNVLYDKGTYN